MLNQNDPSSIKRHHSVKVFRNIGIAFAIMGALFKIMHWPNASFLIIVGAIGIFSSSVVNLILKESKVIEDWLQIPLFGFWIGYGLLKIFHYLYQVECLMGAILTTVIYVLVYILGSKNKDNRFNQDEIIDEKEYNDRQEKVSYGKKEHQKFTKILLIVGLIITPVGVILKILHWPFASVGLIVGMAILSTYFVLSILKTK